MVNGAEFPATVLELVGQQERQTIMVVNPDGLACYQSHRQADRVNRDSNPFPHPLAEEISQLGVEGRYVGEALR